MLSTCNLPCCWQPMHDIIHRVDEVKYIIYLPIYASTSTRTSLHVNVTKWQRRSNMTLKFVVSNTYVHAVLWKRWFLCGGYKKSQNHALSIKFITDFITHFVIITCTVYNSLYTKWYTCIIILASNGKAKKAFTNSINIPYRYIKCTSSSRFVNMKDGV